MCGSSNPRIWFLLDSDFTTLPAALFEGRRVVNNVTKSIWDLLMKERSTASYCPHYVLPISTAFPLFRIQNHIIGPGD